MKILEIIYKILRYLSFLFLTFYRKVRSVSKESGSTDTDVMSGSDEEEDE